MLGSRRAEYDFIHRNLIYWILIGICVIIIYYIVKNVIKKLLFV